MTCRTAMDGIKLARRPTGIGGRPAADNTVSGSVGFAHFTGEFHSIPEP
jgi:hypothetical protein